MMVTPLIIWFLAPLLLGGLAGFVTGFAFSKLVIFIASVKHISRNKKDNHELNKLIKNNLESDNYNRLNLNDFIAKQDGDIYVGKISDNQKEIIDVVKVDYESIDYDLSQKLNKEKILIW